MQMFLFGGKANSKQVSVGRLNSIWIDGGRLRRIFLCQLFSVLVVFVRPTDDMPHVRDSHSASELFPLRHRTLTALRVTHSFRRLQRSPDFPPYPPFILLLLRLHPSQIPLPSSLHPSVGQRDGQLFMLCWIPIVISTRKLIPL